MKPLFRCGHVVMTPGVNALLETFGDGQELGKLLLRHLSGDWGNVPPEDAKENTFSVKNGYRILSAYTFKGERVWVITEADRSVTTFLLPEEY